MGTKNDSILSTVFFIQVGNRVVTGQGESRPGFRTVLRVEGEDESSPYFIRQLI